MMKIIHIFSFLIIILIILVLTHLIFLIHKYNEIEISKKSFREISSQILITDKEYEVFPELSIHKNVFMLGLGFCLYFFPAQLVFKMHPFFLSIGKERNQ